MKKSALLLFSAIVIFNAVIAQQIDSRQKVTTYYPKAQEKLPGIKMINHSGNLNLPSLCLNPPDQSLKSASKIKLDSVIVSSRSSDSEPWIRSDRKTYEYDKEFRLVKIATTSGLYDWEGSYPIVRFFYNSAGLVDSLQFYDRDDYKITNDYIKFIYDSSGRLYQSTYFYDNDGTLQDRKTYIYDESGRLSEIIMYEEWWFPSTSYHRFSYNSEGKLIEYRVDDVYGMLASYEWNSDGNLIAENYSQLCWGIKRQQIYYYAADGNRVKSEHFDWKKNYNASDFKLSLKRTEEYTYLDDHYQDLVDLHLSLLYLNNELDEIEYCPKNLISTITEKIENGSTGSLPKFQKSVYYYSSLPDYSSLPVTVIKDKTISDFRIYPNPASDHITFTWQAGYPSLNLKIFNLSGCCVAESEISSQETINICKLPKGIYLYKLSEKMQMLKTGKLVIE